MIKNRWYIVCFNSELGGKKPVSRKIVGEEVVAFRTKNGKIAVLENRCCHRNVHLSLGKVCGESIKCGYHGWEYGGDGNCTHIPSLPDDRSIPKTARVRSYPVELRHSAVWAFFGDPTIKQNYPIPPMAGLDNWNFVFKYYEIQAALPVIAESLYDSHHLNHVHSNSIGSIIGNLGGGQTDYHLETTPDSLKGWYYRANHRNFFEKIYFGFREKVETHFGFWFPNTSVLDLRFPKQLHFPARNMIIYQHFYEMDEKKCMIINITAWKNIFRFNPLFARFFMSRKSDQIVKEDIAFLESNREWHSSRSLTDLLTPADHVSFAFKKIWNENLENEPQGTHSEKAPQLQGPSQYN